jgi:hypothetical protein
MTCSPLVLPRMGGRKPDVKVKYHIYKRGGVWMIRLRRRDDRGKWVTHRGCLASVARLENAWAFVVDDIKWRLNKRKDLLL